MHKIKLLSCGSYVLSPKISTKELNSKTYITTDNMLPNKEGIVEAKNIPKDITVTKFIKDDILLSNIRPYLKKIWLAEFEGGCSADVLVFRVNKNYNPIYIKYCLSQDLFFKYNMLGAKGSKMPRGDKNHILNFEIFDIDFPSQKSIAKTLLLLDNKIQLNNKINNELEKMTKELYDYWFIQFEFPDKNNRPYKTNKGKMIYNPILKKEIPADWKVQNLFSNDLTKIIEPGIDIFREEKIYLPTSSINNDSIIDFSNKITFDNRESRANMQPIKNSVWFAKMKSSKKILYFGEYSNFYLEKLIISTGMCGLCCKENFSLEYIWNFINSDIFEIRKDIIAHGATQQAVNNEDLAFIHLLVPSKEILNLYHLKTKELYYKKYINEIENYNLIQLRDFLLPMLMNGQISIKD